jgi:hypothetical protein
MQATGRLPRCLRHVAALAARAQGAHSRAHAVEHVHRLPRATPTLPLPQVSACFTGAGARGYAAFSAFRGCFNSWLALPGFHLLPDGLLAVAYFVAVAWLFLGVAIAADIFMVGRGARRAGFGWGCQGRKGLTNALTPVLCSLS